MADKEEHVSCGGGCLGPVIAIVLLWGLIWGVTIDGHHYGIKSRDTKNGVIIDK